MLLFYISIFQIESPKTVAQYFEFIKKDSNGHEAL